MVKQFTSGVYIHIMCDTYGIIFIIKHYVKKNMTESCRLYVTIFIVKLYI